MPAGTYHACEKQPLLLQAFLGSCVGLALYCKSSKVGGMIHLLLPEPVSSFSYSPPEKYAKTGVPVFIESLIAAGAKKETLSASIAGGALVGPLQRQDLDLDIGGRTAEVVRKILSREGIKIVNSETGGFFTCCLNLNTVTGEATIEPAGQSKLSKKAQVKTATAEEIKTAINALKPIPQVALKVMRLMDENRCDIESIANEIRKDQVITARMLQLANSAMFPTKKKISSLDHAIVYLGQDLLVKLVLTAAVQGYYEQSGMGYALCKGGVYFHSVGCAHVAEILARKTNREDSAKAYTAGLLHDIGKVVLDQYVASAYPLFYRDLMKEKGNILSIEKQLLGMDHTEVGYLLARQWSFPPSLAYTIRHHHRTHPTAEHAELSAIVYLADLFMSRFHTGLEIERLGIKALNQHLETLGLTHGNLEDLIDSIPLSVFLTEA